MTNTLALPDISLIWMLLQTLLFTYFSGVSAASSSPTLDPHSDYPLPPTLKASKSTPLPTSSILAMESLPSVEVNVDSALDTPFSITDNVWPAVLPHPTTTELPVSLALPIKSGTEQLV
eukprot:TRINITY_DN12854_c0_g1_i1.p1 TRINITY_DN12854_c0_g1~~TRINITY_DN12854_c0_g1_i1.p1  ORF type:complete len:119 (+),score=7.09 TRINITY_DN12854_c0_g1_i1:707-1063(+)